jgi:hypothetical protein
MTDVRLPQLSKALAADQDQVAFCIKAAMETSRLSIDHCLCF